jgi:hypothetical protein
MFIKKNLDKMTGVIDERILLWGPEFLQTTNKWDAYKSLF